MLLRPAAGIENSPFYLTSHINNKMFSPYYRTIAAKTESESPIRRYETRTHLELDLERPLAHIGLGQNSKIALARLCMFLGNEGVQKSIAYAKMKIIQTVYSVV
ncbi:MAG: hypothetical protein N3D16_03540 [Anaerolineales bacterium]|nr:hypothetical protein [Anaerolineales bacterium]